jgi:hypothetical protein
MVDRRRLVSKGDRCEVKRRKRGGFQQDLLRGRTWRVDRHDSSDRIHIGKAVPLGVRTGRGLDLRWSHLPHPSQMVDSNPTVAVKTWSVTLTRYSRWLPTPSRVPFVAHRTRTTMGPIRSRGTRKCKKCPGEPLTIQCMHTKAGKRYLSLVSARVSFFLLRRSLQLTIRWQLDDDHDGADVPSEESYQGQVSVTQTPCCVVLMPCPDCPARHKPSQPAF